MITVQITEHEIIVSGHARPENPEHRAVCAAVSAACQTTAQWFALAGIEEAATEPREGGGIMVFDIAKIVKNAPKEYSKAAAITIMTLAATLSAQAKAWPEDITIINDK